MLKHAPLDLGRDERKKMEPRRNLRTSTGGAAFAFILGSVTQTYYLYLTPQGRGEQLTDK